jgi:hypothetical protein
MSEHFFLFLDEMQKRTTQSRYIYRWSNGRSIGRIRLTRLGMLQLVFQDRRNLKSNLLLICCPLALASLLSVSYRISADQNRTYTYWNCETNKKLTKPHFYASYTEEWLSLEYVLLWLLKILEHQPTITHWYKALGANAFPFLLRNELASNIWWIRLSPWT